MEIQKKRQAGIDSNKKFFWAPGMEWVKNGDMLTVDSFNYTGAVAELFPEFYYKVQKGISLNELVQEFPAVNKEQLEEFTKDLVDKSVLVYSILSPYEVFRPQTKLFKNEYSEEIFFDAVQLEKYKKKQLSRVLAATDGKKIKLEQQQEYPEFIAARRTCRVFDSLRKIPADTFSNLMSFFRQVTDGDKIRYYYACSGGLYPIDIYVYVKDGRVEGIKGGLYYYSPVDNSMILTSSSCVITDEAHVYTNKDIFKSSAFSIFFIYNAGVTMPKYGGMAYHYACIDTGIMVGALTAVAELNNIGLCSIGNMNFEKIKKYFRLNENQVLIHTVEGGLKEKCSNI